MAATRIMRYDNLLKRVAEDPNVKMMVCIRSTEDMNETFAEMIAGSTNEFIDMVRQGRIAIVQAFMDVTPMRILDSIFHPHTLCRVKDQDRYLLFQMYKRAELNGEPNAN
jgi:hypothetical protein